MEHKNQIFYHGDSQLLLTTDPEAAREFNHSVILTSSSGYDLYIKKCITKNGNAWTSDGKYLYADSPCHCDAPDCPLCKSFREAE